ncbi:methylisocitrate lyase [Fluviispira multicolorata]|uniref:Methylisocitrate lyase n=1 Tax=Fluviispira multicolorata TaxID=2654512 RepID=A0A833N336_9BACT|nr:methylisocitrate lyase [Fluviispira multicolorata]KAB8027734.1 methylisocitrate lyase [Fluviispira multicolorata]
MLFPECTPSEKRKNLRSVLKTGKLLQFPGSWSPLVSMAIEKQGFDGVYISGSVLSNDLGYPDIGMTTLTEVGQRGRQISRTTNLPTIIDIDTGFGEPMNATRSVQEMIEMGLAGCHIEDQINPKRCGHLDGKAVVSQKDMVHKVTAAILGKKLDENFLIIARTDARAVEGLDKAIERSKAYIDAGAECIFIEALENEKEFEIFRKAISVPLLVNMTEFGKSKLFTYEQLSNLGYNIVIYPVTTFRLAMKATVDGLLEIKSKGTQEGILDQMQHRKDLYSLSRYEEYNSFDQNIFNFKHTLKTP